MIFRFSNRGGRGVLPLILLICSLLSGQLWASGVEEGEFNPGMELDAAQALVDEGKLDEAIEALVQIARQDPEQMERVQRIILDIQDYKNNLNGLFAEAVEAIGVEDGDKALTILNTIKENFPYLNRSDRNKLIIITTAVGRQADLDIQDRYFDRAEVLLANADYLGAVDIYREGIAYKLYLDLDFYQLYLESAEIKAPIDRYSRDDPYRQGLIWDAYSSIAPQGEELIRELENSLDAWELDAQELPRIASTAVSGISNTDPAAWSVETRTLVSSLDVFIDDIRNVQANANELNSTRLALNTALEDTPEEFHYERIVQYLFGRSGQEEQEGIFYAEEKLWEQSFLDVAGRMSDILDQQIELGRNAYLTGDRNTVEQTMATAGRAASALSQYLNQADDVLESHRLRGIERFRSILEEFDAYSAYAADAAPLWSELSTLQDSASRAENLDFETLDITAVESLAIPIQNSVTRTEEMISQWNETETFLVQMAASGSPRPSSIDTRLRADLNQAIDDFRELRLSLYLNAIIPIYNNKESEAQSAMAIDIDALRIRVNGEASDTTLPEKHSSETLSASIEPALIRLDNADVSVGEFLDIVDEMLSLDPPIDNPEEVIAYQTRAENLVLDIDEVRRQLETLKREALILASAARSAETSAVNTLETARRDLEAAKAAVRRGGQTNDIEEFYNAVDLYNSVDSTLSQVDEFYNIISNNDIDIAENSGIAEAKNSLRNQVNADKGLVAVTVKQNAVEEGRDAYDEGRYAYGISIVTQAQDFYNRANGEDDPELAGWLQRLINAQQALQQTVIEPIDPLYAEMNQYLNLANRYFEAGVRIAEDDPRNADAMLSFRAAVDLLGQVLSTFPGNESALLLEQKILRQTDFDTWSSGAAELMTEAKRAVEREAEIALRGSDQEKGLYAQLVVLAQIEPDYNGLADLINEAKIVLGLIPRPVPEPDRNESLALTTQARQIWDNLGLNGADRAVVLLDQALTIWFENRDASALKNEIQLQSTPDIVPPLPTELERRISLANNFVDEGNVSTARRIYDSIIQEYPGYKDDYRVVELGNRVGIQN